MSEHQQQKQKQAILDAIDALRESYDDQAEYDAALAAVFVSVGIKQVNIEDIKPSHYPEFLAALSAAVIGRKKTPKILTDVCAEWVWAVGPERFVRIKDGRLWSRSQFDSRYNHFLPAGTSISALIFKTANAMKRFEAVDFRPGRSLFDAVKFNMWRPSQIVAKQGDTTIFHEHLKYLFPDEADRNRVWFWLCWVYRHQDKRPNHALLLVGKKTGTGKSFVARVMEQLLGKENTQRPKNSSLKGDFNGWVVKCKLCIIEELMQIGRKEVTNELRNTITEPTVEVNIKNVPAFLIDNYAAMFGISNHPDALPLEEEDRRWIVVGTKADKAPPEYYRRLFTILEGPKSDELLAAIAWDLKYADIGDYDARLAVDDDSEAKREMIGFAVTPLVKWLRQEIAAGNYPFNLQLVNIRHDIIPLVPIDVLPRGGGSLETLIQKFFREDLEATNLGDRAHRLSRGKQAAKGTLWGINGGSAKYATTTTGAITDAYLAAKAGHSPEAANDNEAMAEAMADFAIDPIELNFLGEAA
jgi:hypothetical protein